MNRALPVVDQHSRPLQDLRISVTDRCNFRCRYCMPREVFHRDFKFLPRSDLLTFEEVVRMVRIATHLGVRKVRITGGEPLLRQDLPTLVSLLAGIDGIDIAMTTNGSLLARNAAALARAGLRRVTVSLDTIDPVTFRKLCDTDLSVDTVLKGIEAAKDAGLAPVKINAVIRQGVNEDAVLPLARYFKGTGHIVRFIEFMDVGSHNAWQVREVLSGGEIVRRIDEEMPLEPAEANYRGEVARRWRYRDGSGEIGVITSVTQPFCGDCSRARLSADGKIFTCLFASRGTSFRELLRDGSSDDEVLRALSDLWQKRTDRYSEVRAEMEQSAPRVEMSYIGG